MNAWRNTLRAVLSLCVFLLSPTVFAQTSVFHTGKQYEKHLSLPASVFWSEVPLREALHSLSRTHHLAIWLDRRCDPNQPISFGANQARLKDCLWKLAEQENGIDATWLENVVFVGPTDSAKKLATVHEIHRQQLHKLERQVQTKWQRRSSWSWPKLTSPVSLVEQLEAELGTTIEGKNEVLHDLWPARSLPPLPLFQRLELLLAGFDLTFIFDGNGARIVRMPRTPLVTLDVKIPPDRLGAVKGVLKDHLNARLENSALTASWRVHELVSRTINPPGTDHDLDRVRYTLRAQNQPVGPFVRSLCKQLDLECDFADAEDEDLERRISFHVERADIRTLFRAILEPAGLQFTLNDAKLRVVRSRTQ